MLLDMLLRATQSAPDTLLGRILRKIDRELTRSAEMDARMEASRPDKGPPERPRTEARSAGERRRASFLPGSSRAPREPRL